MKKSTQNDRLAFNKAIVTELNDATLLNINGNGRYGNEPTTYACSNCILIPKTLQTLMP